MSVSDQIFLRTDKSPAEVAGLLAERLSGHVAERNGTTWLFLDPAVLMGHSDRTPGDDFGGPVVAHRSELPFRPDGEFEATDFYNVELRLWLSGTKRGEFEALLADKFFAVVAAEGFTAVHVRNDDVLIRAAMPGAGTREFPVGTTIYDSDQERWGGFVLTS